MRGTLHKLVNRVAGRLAIDLGWARRGFAEQAGRFRVLTYHGLVPDHLADRAWVPSHYVTVSQFERQMAMLAELGPAPLIGEALAGVRADGSAPPTVCITFDDGMADNITLALPILRQFGHRATFFLTTGHVETGRPLLNDVVRLLRPLYEAGRLGDLGPVCRRVFDEPGFLKSGSVREYHDEIMALWAAWKAETDADGRRALAMMSWEQARTLDDAGMEVGAHTVSHVILAREPRRPRRDEIVESIARVSARIGRFEVPFAYPNGLEGDYDGFDRDLLAAIGTPYAVSERTGWNDADTPRLELRRNCIGRHCSDRAFLARVFGLGDGPAGHPESERGLEIAATA